MLIATAKCHPIILAICVSEPLCAQAEWLTSGSVVISDKAQSSCFSLKSHTSANIYPGTYVSHEKYGLGC